MGLSWYCKIPAPANIPTRSMALSQCKFSIFHISSILQSVFLTTSKSTQISGRGRPARPQIWLFRSCKFLRRRLLSSVQPLSYVDVVFLWKLILCFFAVQWVSWFQILRRHWWEQRVSLWHSCLSVGRVGATIQNQYPHHLHKCTCVGLRFYGIGFYSLRQNCWAPTG